MAKIRLLVDKYVLSVTVLLVATTAALTAFTVLRSEDSRSQNIVRICENQNDRHTATVREVNYLFAQFASRTPKSKRAELAASKTFTLLIVDSLAPYQNCQHVLAKSR